VAGRGSGSGRVGIPRLWRDVPNGVEIGSSALLALSGQAGCRILEGLIAGRRNRGRPRRPDRKCGNA
jgi:hypothetical protein